MLKQKRKLIYIATFFTLFVLIEWKQNEPVLKVSQNKLSKKACIIALVTNEDLSEFIQTIAQFETNFNQKYNYSYIFFNNKNFTQHFKNEILKHTNSLVEFGLISEEQWNVPKWINETRLNASLNTIGFSLNYRHMCRFFSGFFFKHELTLKYDYFLRIDSDSMFPCEIKEDPFVKLIENNYKYGFILSNGESRFTIPNLWNTIKEWLNKTISEQTLNKNSVDFISNDIGNSLSSDDCIFYNNFEIASFNLYRDKKYLDFFDYLDKSGGFFYERWVNYNCLKFHIKD